MKKIALFGGTFSPVHIGHLILGQFVLNTSDITEVIYVPANIAPNKEGKVVLSEKHRFEMLKIAVADNKKLDASDFEIRKGGISYTINTIAFFKQLYPELSIIIGMDQAIAFKTWKDYNDIFRLVKILVFERAGWHQKDIPKDIQGKFTILENPFIEISSSDIRISLKESKSVRYLVPDTVINYIIKNKIYR